MQKEKHYISLQHQNSHLGPAVVNSLVAHMSKAHKMAKWEVAHGHYGHTGPTWSAFFYEKEVVVCPTSACIISQHLQDYLVPPNQVAITTIVNPERTVDNKGKIKVVAEDNAMVIMEHSKGALSHMQCGQLF
jgi:hypothetical protein